MRDGHISDVEMLPGLTDEEAVFRAQKLFEARKDAARYDGFEVWEQTRKIISVHGHITEIVGTRNKPAPRG
jgi:hypothetical protein